MDTLHHHSASPFAKSWFRTSKKYKWARWWCLDFIACFMIHDCSPWTNQWRAALATAFSNLVSLGNSSSILEIYEKKSFRKTSTQKIEHFPFVFVCSFGWLSDERRRTSIQYWCWSMKEKETTRFSSLCLYRLVFLFSIDLCQKHFSRHVASGKQRSSNALLRKSAWTCDRRNAVWTVPPGRMSMLNSTWFAIFFS